MEGPEDSSALSMKSDRSMDLIVVLRNKDTSPQFREKNTVPAAGPSGLSMKSDRSMDPYVDFNNGHPPFHFDGQSSESQRSQSTETGLDTIFMILEENIITFVKAELKMLQQALSSDSSEWFESVEEHSSRGSFLKITVDFMKRMQQEHLAEFLHSRSNFGVHQQKLKSLLKQRFNCVFEGIPKLGNQTLLNQIYTELYITERGATEVNQEHEVRYIEAFSRRVATPETTIICADIFKITTKGKKKPKPDIAITRHKLFDVGNNGNRENMEITEAPIRTVLTKGVAGIGKTVLTQKFSLDWAEGRANQDIQLLFPFTFRELNVLRDSQFSLVGLLHHFFSQTKELCSFEGLQIVFILDGLDECRLPLDFSRTRVLTDPTESVSVEELLVNLIRGSLLPCARLWITTRPAAANQIPAECVSIVTEVRGFTDPQKEQYFWKRFRDGNQASAIISQIKKSQSLDNMCQLPVFCWILSNVQQHLIQNGITEQLPQTLTEMYIHFLVVQATMKNLKYGKHSEMDQTWTPETKEMVQSLGKLAFEQLQKGNLIFYESELRECGVDITAASVYSGVFTQVFREEPGLCQEKVYSFIHLSVQEFMAALHVHITFIKSGINLLSGEKPLTSKIIKTMLNVKPQLAQFLQSAVDKALQSPNGHLDLFLRFLLGLSLPGNQRLLRGFLPQSTGSSQAIKKTVEYIKEKINENILTERIINLFHCLNELKDCSLVKQIQQYIHGEQTIQRRLSPAQWSALAFLLSSGQDLEEFDLKKYYASEDVCLRLLPVIKVSTTALLSSCNLSKICCGPLSAVLSSTTLTHLDLSNNDLQDTGVELLCSGLKSAPCRLDTLSLSGCLVTERGGASLAAALSSTPSHLRKLDLSYNHLGASAELLTALLRDPTSSLDSLRVKPAGQQWLTPGLSKYLCQLTLDPNTVHRNLHFAPGNRRVQYVEDVRSDKELGESRPESCPKALCSSALAERCYWEAYWETDWDTQKKSGCRRSVTVAVSYRQENPEEEGAFGLDERSWSLTVSNAGYVVRHNGQETTLRSVCPSRSFGCVGVYVDCSAGSLSFYESSSKELLHLHTFNTAFTEELFAGFGLESGCVFLTGSNDCLCKWTGNH